MFDEDVQDEEETPRVEATIDPVVRKKQALKDALMALTKGNVQLGNFGQLSVDVDPFGEDKSASLELTVPFGKGRRR